MSWRDILITAEPQDNTRTQNPHNPQYSSRSLNIENCVDFVDSAWRVHDRTPEVEAMCRDLKVDESEFLDALTDDERRDLRRGTMPHQKLRELASCVAQRKRMDEGRVPRQYDKIAHCRGCGPVWLWIESDVLGCPWCWNRARQLPFPQPPDRHLS